jgi:hypothetical protein
MEATIMFAVGALTMVLLAVASLAVYSTVMVLKLKKESHIDRTEIWRGLHSNHEIVYRKFEDVERQLRGEMRCGEQELNLRQDQLNEHIGQLERATDRRFDKLIDTYLLVKETEKESKKIIKG